MLKRLLILAPLLSLLGLSLVGWVWSGNHWASLHCGTATFRIECGTFWGVVHFAADRRPFGPRGVHVYTNRIPETRALPPGVYHTQLGFAWACQLTPDDALTHVTVPYWFLLFCLALLTITVWHTARPKPRRANAFPIELTRS